MVIRKNTINTCIFTLAEKTTLTPVFYLFELTNSQDGTSKVFLSADVSTNKLRYNEFKIEETGSENLAIGKVSLSLLEGWEYKIYQQSSSTNLNISLTGSLVENGRIDVKGTEVSDETFTSERTIKVFND